MSKEKVQIGSQLWLIKKDNKYFAKWNMGQEKEIEHISQLQQEEDGCYVIEAYGNRRWTQTELDLLFEN